MSSSIFSSDVSPRILIKIFGTSLLLLVVYGFTTRKIEFKTFTAQSQFQENKYKGERFISRINTISTSEYNAIVGSSLSALLKEEYFSTHTINIAFAGGSSLTGLEYVIRSGSLFKKIFIDATVLRPIDHEMMSLIEDSTEYWRIQNLLLTNVDHQPMSILTNFIKEKFGVASKRQFDPKQFKQGLLDQKQADADFNQGQRKDFLNRLKILKDKILLLEDRGIEVVMLEMPLDPQVSSLSMFKFQREALRNEFKKEVWIGGDRPQLQTLDGLHLSVDSAMLFAREIEGLK